MIRGKDVRDLIGEGLSKNTRCLMLDGLLKAANDDLWIIIGEVAGVVDRALGGIDLDKLDERDFTIYLIMANCLSDLSAAAHNLMLGLHRPTAMILRGVVENVALMVTLSLDEKVFAAYKADEYKIPKAISKARSVIPAIGELNGLLSEKFIHEPHSSVGRAFEQNDTEITIYLVPPLDRNGGSLQLLLNCKVALGALMLGEAVEYCLADHLDEFIYNEKTGSELKRITTSPGFDVYLRLSSVLAEKVGVNLKMPESRS